MTNLPPNPNVPPSLPVNPAYANYVPRGWWPLVEELHTHLAFLDPTYSAGQVKEKFGTLRFYYDPTVAPDSAERKIMDALVSFAERLSARTCESCGGHGSMRNIGGWARTLCERCYSREVSGDSGDVPDTPQDS